LCAGCTTATDVEMSTAGLMVKVTMVGMVMESN
jgi:hypothetical protein